MGSTPPRQVIGLRGVHYFLGKIESLFVPYAYILIYSERTLYSSLNLLHFSLRSSIFIFHWDMGVSDSGPKIPQILNFVKNQKLWCQIVDNRALFLKLRIFNMWNLTEVCPPQKAPKISKTTILFTSGLLHSRHMNIFEVEPIHAIALLWIYVKETIVIYKYKEKHTKS